MSKLIGSRPTHPADGEMLGRTLAPTLSHLCDEHVLVQAWKKAAAHIRYHNWFADSLELDLAAVNLRRFIGDLRRKALSGDWRTEPLMLVPAPKSQSWGLDDQGVEWRPREDLEPKRLRPLAHVGLGDQVMATAITMCLADRIETSLKDPRRRDVLSGNELNVAFGSRLYCDDHDDGLRHRWSSSKLYRAYYHDYREFLRRPDAAAQRVSESGRSAAVVHSDIGQFYDHVRPAVLHKALRHFQRSSDEDPFFAFAEKVLDWSWAVSDSDSIGRYANSAGIEGFERVGLPQGLACAGFFSNVVLSRFDDKLRGSIGRTILPGVELVDFCRYVDDLRLVVSIEETNSERILRDIREWLHTSLDIVSPRLRTSESKSEIFTPGANDRPVLQIRRKMDRIQRMISGGFDASVGEEILESIQALTSAVPNLPETNQAFRHLSPGTDVRDETVARFAAARFRTTFRSLRPLLDVDGDREMTDVEIPASHRRPRTQLELDSDCQAFAHGLVSRWITDPANVRLLRIAVDLWPDPKLLSRILGYIRPHLRSNRFVPSSAAWYSLGELFRAATFETGITSSEEQLPAGTNLPGYRDALFAEAIGLLNGGFEVPWYVRQHVLVFLATCRLSFAVLDPVGPHERLLEFLRTGEADSDEEWVRLAILARRAFRSKEETLELLSGPLTPERLTAISQCDPDFGQELFGKRPGMARIPEGVRNDLCVFERELGTTRSLADWVLSPEGEKLRAEKPILDLAIALCNAFRLDGVPAQLGPCQVRVTGCVNDSGFLDIEQARIVGSGSTYVFRPPRLDDSNDQWRYKLGYLLRFVLIRQPDFTAANDWTREALVRSYRIPRSDIYERLFGTFNGHSAFGDPWLPISEWVEDLIYSLLRAPGTSRGRLSDAIDAGPEKLGKSLTQRLSTVWGRYAPATRSLILPIRAKCGSREIDSGRPLRGCVVQTAFPTYDDYRCDLTCSDKALRARHRRHLFSALEVVRRSLRLRETHHAQSGRLDLLILPEMSVHPEDVKAQLIPFARANKTIILAGLTHQYRSPPDALVNSAIWIIPELTSKNGWKFHLRYQGKKYPTHLEEGLGQVEGYRPCQWVVNYEATGIDDALRLTAAVCYDATDLGLASDLKGLTDVFAVPAFNKDVNTFDQMSLALHYHMYQMVVIANSGQYGGSNAYVPYVQHHEKRVFHVHGQPQASVVFFEIDEIPRFRNRQDLPPGATAPAGAEQRWKSRPAGWGNS